MIAIMLAYYGLIMAMDDAVETLQCSLAISNAISQSDVSPFPNTKKQTGTRGNETASSGLEVGCGIKANSLTKELSLRMECHPWKFF